MSSEDMSNPLDILHPHETEVDEAQQSWLSQKVQTGDRVLDLGCGGGRTLLPLVKLGAICTGIDHDPIGLEWFRNSMSDEGLVADLIEADFHEWLSAADGHWDLICCLGNTFCQIWNINKATDLMSQVRQRLAPGGCFVIDDIPGDLWPEVAAGYWQEGLDPDSGQQLVWADDDLIFTLRPPETADPENWNLSSDDVRLRLWTAGSLQLAAQVAGFEVPFVPEKSGVRVLTPRN
ncbi:MAG: hypothetical protein CMJ39_04510 [Phycisphaerae bacterium]|nr:hypothetical protein [Phycisphaerae bacterium]